MLFLIIFRWTYPKVCPANAYLIHWNEIDLIEFLTVHSKVVALSPVVPRLSIFSRDIGVRCVKSDQRTTFINPPRFTLHAPELPLYIFNHQIIPLVPTMGS